VIKLIGKAAYGIQGLSNTVLGYFLVMDMNIDIALIKYLAEDKAKNDTIAMNKLLNITLKIYLIIGVIGMSAILLLSNILVKRVFLIPDELVEQAKVVFYLTSIGFFASALNMWVRAIASGLQKYQYSNILSIATNVLGSVLGVYFAYIGYGLVGFTLAKVGVAILVAIVFFFIIIKEFPFFKLDLKFDKLVFKRIVGFTSYGVLLRISGLIFNRLDVLFIGMWVSASAVGVYSIPLMIFTTLSYFISAMFHFFFPMSSELYSTNQLHELKQILIKLSKFLTALSAMLYIPIFIFAKTILRLWVGVEISNEADVLLSYLMIAGFLGTIFATNVGTLMIGIGHVKEFTIYSISKSIVNSLLFILFIKRYGIEGAGLTLLLTTLLDFAVLLFALNKYLCIDVTEYLRKVYPLPVCLGAAIGLPFFFFSNIVNGWLTLVMALALYEVSYLVLGFLFGVFGETEKKALTVVLNVFTQRFAKE
jgi:O-antigen/teichoic acid export membrane protein